MNRVFTILDFNGDTGRALNLSGFTNYQKPIGIDVLQKAVADGKIVAISPESIAKLENDLEKAFQTDFEASDKFSALVSEVKSYRRVLVQRGEEVVEFLVKATQAEDETDDEVEKAGGEGSRGGKVIGHTKSGKPVYASRSSYHSSYSDFSDEDHEDAAKLHRDEANKYQQNVLASKRGGSQQDSLKKMMHDERAASHANRKKKGNIEKGDEFYSLSGGIGEGDKELPLKKKGSDIKTAFGVIVARLTAECETLMATMAKCLEEIGTPPTESPWNATDRLVGKRYSWEVCDSSIPAGGPAPQRNACREYNNAFDALCSNFRTLKLCKAYMENLKDDKEYDVNPSLHVLLF